MESSNFNNPALRDALSRLDLSHLPEAVATIQANDPDISGGRVIAHVKSNQLFTGQFEKSDLDAFTKIWTRYRRNPKMPLKQELMQQSKAMIRNYRGEVCPIEVMLYTSNLAANMFINRKLLDDVADVVCSIVREKDGFLRSLKHILHVWKWEQTINVCEIAAGKLGDEELLRYIYDNFHYQEEVSYGCFCALMESRNELFVPDILSMVHDLTGTDADKQIGNKFKEKFGVHFPEYRKRLDGNMFRDAKPYAKDLVRRMLNPERNDNLAGQYKNATNQDEQKYLLHIATERVLHFDGSGSPYDAINTLKLAANEAVSERLFRSLDLDGKPKQRSTRITTAVIANYFGSINYPPAIQAFSKVDPTHEYYAPIRMALFFQDKVSSDDVVGDFLAESRPDQIKMYLACFFNLGERLPPVRAATVRYLSTDLDDDRLSTAIMNYYQLIQKYRHLYDPQVGELIQGWFGYGTAFGTIQIRLQEQNTCLKIIQTIIDDFNYKKYENFLYFVAEEGMEFQPSVCNLAKTILQNLKSTTIKA